MGTFWGVQKQEGFLTLSADSGVTREMLSESGLRRSESSECGSGMPKSSWHSRGETQGWKAVRGVSLPGGTSVTAPGWARLGFHGSWEFCRICEGTAQL